MQKAIVTSLSQNSKECILCGRCLAVCPAFLATEQEELSPRAKMHTLEAFARAVRSAQAAQNEQSTQNTKVTTNALATSALPAFSPQKLSALAELCVGCERCEKACPQGLSVPRLLADLRAAEPTWQQKLWKTWLTHMPLLWLGAQSITTYAPKLLPQALRPLLQSACVLHKDAGKRKNKEQGKGLNKEKNNAAPLFSYAPTNAVFFVKDAATKDAPMTSIAPSAVRPTAPRSLMLFSGCGARTVRPAWQKKALTLLQASGVNVLPEADFSCCGGSLEKAGAKDAARHAALHNIALWRASGKPTLVTFCASCRKALNDYALQENTADAQFWQSEEERDEWKACIVPLASFLNASDFTPILAATASASLSASSSASHVELQAELRAELQDNSLTNTAVCYHEPCHSAVLDNNNDADKTLLRALFAAPQAPAFFVHAGHCCGMGGIAQLSEPALCKKIAAHCWQHIQELATLETALTASPASSNVNANFTAPTAPNSRTSPNTASPLRVISSCSACVMQLAATAPQNIRVQHWLDIVLCPAEIRK